MGADGTSASTIVAKILDGNGAPIAAPSAITFTLGNSSPTSCNLTSNTIIPAGASDSSSNPGNVIATTTPGACSISGTATGGYSGPVSSVTITTTGLGQIQLPAEVLVPPQGVVTFTVSLPTAAPVGGSVINLSTVSSSIATVTASITIPAGQSTGQAQLTGVAAGQTSLSAASAAGTYASATTVATVATVFAGFSAAGGQAISSVTVPATTSTQAQVTLTKAAPQGGLVMSLTTASAAIATLGSGVSTTNVFIPAGQLTSPVFTVNGVAQGTTTVTASNAAVTSASLSVQVGPAPALSLNGGTSSIGAQMHRTFTVYLNSPAPAGGLTVTLSGFNAAVASPAVTSVTIPAGYTSGGYEFDGIAVGSTSLTASATGWASATITVSVVNPTLYLSGFSTPVTTLTVPGQTYVQVQSPYGDVLTTAQLITFSVSSTPSTGVEPIPANVTIAAGTNYVWFTPPTATGAGTYTVTATAPNVPGAPVSNVSNIVTVNQPSLSLNGGGSSIGAQMHRTFTVYLSDPAPAGGLTVTLSGFNAAVASPAAATVTILAGYTSGGYEFDGNAVGTTSLTASATSWASATITVSVVNPTLYLYSLNSPVTTLTVPGQTYVQVQSPYGDVLTTAQLITFSVSSTPSTGVEPIPANVTIAAGTSYVWFTPPTATGGGTYTVTATAPNVPGAPVSNVSNTVTVTQPSITLSGANGWIANGMHRNFAVYLSDPAPSPGLTVTLHSADATIAGVPATVTVPTGSTSAAYEVDGNGIGAGPTASTTLSASAAGWNAATINVNVINPTLYIYPLQSSVTTYTVPAQFYVQLQTPNGGSDMVTAAAGVQVNFSVSSSPSGIEPTPASVTILAGTNYIWLTPPTATAVGSYFLTATAPSAAGSPSATSNTVTVGNPYFSINSGNPSTVSAGMHHSLSIYLSDPAPIGGVVVTLSGFAPGTASPASTTVSIGSGYQSGSFELDGIAAGSTSIVATAPSPWTSPPALAVTVVNPTLFISGLQSTVNVGVIPNQFYVQLLTSGSSYDYVTASGGQSVTFTVSSTPSGIEAAPATVTIAAGQNYIYLTPAAATGTGTYTFTATATGIGANPSATSIVVTVS